MAPSTYYAHQQCQRHPELHSQRIKRDEVLCEDIQRIWHDNYGVYGARKVWHALLLEGLTVARCTIERSVPTITPWLKPSMAFTKANSPKGKAGNHEHSLKSLPLNGCIGLTINAS